MKMIKLYLVRSKSTLLNHIIALNVLCVRKTLIQPLQKMFDFASEKKKTLTNSTYSGILEIFFPYTKTY